MNRFILVLLLTVPLATGFGVSPSAVDFVGPGPHTYDLHITNLHDEEITIDIRPDGEAGAFIQPSRHTVSLSMDEDGIVVPIVVDASDVLPGEYVGGVVLEQQSMDAADGSIRALPAVRQRVTLRIPGDGLFIDASLGTSAAAAGQPMTVTAAVRNVGTEDVQGLEARFGIHDQRGELLATRTTGQVFLASGEQKNLRAEWTPGAAGAYTIRANITYDGGVVLDETVVQVGDLDVDLDAPRFAEFTPGEIVRISIPVTSRWNGRLASVHGEVRILRDGEPIESIVTASEDIPALGRTELLAYWDTADVPMGQYTMEVEARFAGQSKLRIDDVDLHAEGASVKRSSWIPAMLFLMAVTLAAVFAARSWKNRKRS